MSREFYSTAYNPYKAASVITGLSEIKLHQLRIAKIARYKNSGYPDHIPLINVEDVQKWIERTGFTPQKQE